MLKLNCEKIIIIKDAFLSQLLFLDNILEKDIIFFFSLTP